MFHASLSRLGPGTDASTNRALSTVLTAAPPPRRDVGGPPRILDLGCGTGAQTLVLASRLDAPMIALDNHRPYLDAARRRAEAAGIAHRVEFRLEDMRTVRFDAGSFDLIWSEGAIFCMGFREGLARCREWLAPGGCFALSELCWLEPDPPGECRRFLEGHYPVMTDVSGNLAAIEAAGYAVLDHFILPQSGWRDEFYDPLEDRLDLLREHCAGDPVQMELIAGVQAEIDMYRRYGDSYGYLFCVLRKT